MCAALLMLSLGAALRPVLLPDNKTTALPVLTETEIGFVGDMATHHEQAVSMVQRLDPGVDRGVLNLAKQIDQAQRYEIGMMQGWLRLANAMPTNPHPMAWMSQAVSPSAGMAGMSGHRPPTSPAATPATEDGAMPGMASMQELDQLSAARGRDAEVLFLQLMLRHHLGGIIMAEALLTKVTSGPVREAASEIAYSQRQESGLMNGMLTARAAVPAPFR
ncbi:DUF305 domain-containing protein [Nocardia brasiliensis]|uniref:DUF305 domain-containing protein n=1 Tax=Nocardia brasiliensis TaxID=37326 RepID=UPI003D8F525E